MGRHRQLSDAERQQDPGVERVARHLATHATTMPARASRLADALDHAQVCRVQAARTGRRRARWSGRPRACTAAGRWSRSTGSRHAGRSGRDHGCGRRLDHHAELHLTRLHPRRALVPQLRTRSLRCSRANSTSASDGDHRHHDLQAAVSGWRAPARAAACGTAPGVRSTCAPRAGRAPDSPPPRDRDPKGPCRRPGRACGSPRSAARPPRGSPCRRLVLLVLVGQVGPVHEQELGAVEPDALGSVAERVRDLLDACPRSRAGRNSTPSLGLGRHVGVAQQLALRTSRTGRGASRTRADCARVGIDQHAAAACAIDDQRRAVAEGAHQTRSPPRRRQGISSCAR